MKPYCMLLLLLATATFAQAPSQPQQPPARPATSNLPFIRDTYTKFEYKVPMRDGVKLFTAVYVPKDVFTDSKTYPVMMSRTPYSVRPYGSDQYPQNLGPSEHFLREKFIFVYQDVRGRYMSEGLFTPVRPHRSVKNGPKDTDESTDNYDTIEWIVKHVPGAIPKVGTWGISAPGFYTSAGMIDTHPAHVAASPQAPVTDYYLGDDVYHNGAFMLAHRFRFYMNFKQREGDPEPPKTNVPFDMGTPDAYEFFLRMGSLANAEEKYFKRQHPFWTLNVENTTYNDVWSSRAIWKHLKSIKPAVMTVGGWFDAEDVQGPLRTHEFMEKNAPPPVNMIVEGPWSHGGWSRGDGDRLGNLNFGAKTGAFYREKIEFPFFLYMLKGKGDGKFPKAWIFETGRNLWHRYETWPPKEATPKSIHLGAGGKLAWNPADGTEAFDEYLADPNKPVPYIGHVVNGMRGDYMTEDQRFAAARPDVLVYESDPLDADVTVMGPIEVDLKVSTTGTDSDFVVKLIDVYPGDAPDYNQPPAPAPGAPATAPAAALPANTIRMGGYQQLVRGEPFRGKFRKSFEKPVPFEPGKPDRITFKMPDVAHTFRPGHRIMVQIQSSWFPLTDRNPQKFMEIPKALSTDFVKATQRVYRGGSSGSKLTLRIMN
jgi:putative CocE/NonD family hydrolase